MSDFDFTPDSENNRQTGSFNEGFNLVFPKTGQRRARVSLIVDLGKQERPDLYEVDGKLKPGANADTPGVVIKKQKPAQQVAVYADLVNDVVDYGGDIGKAQYRMCLNKSFKNVLQGINFYKSPVMDVKGKDTGKPWQIHAQNLLTKLALACNEPSVPESANLGKLLNKQFMIDIDIKETPSGKEDKNGDEIIYKNISFKSVSKVSPVFKEDENGDEIEVIPEFAELQTPAMCITFTNATADKIKFIRKGVIQQIKLAQNYAGSNMQKAIEEFEAQQADAEAMQKGSEESTETKAAEKPAKKESKAKKPVAPDPDLNDDVPF